MKCIISVEGKEYEIEYEYFTELYEKGMQILKEEKGKTVCTISFTLEGELITQEFKTLGFLATFLSGLSIGEITAWNKLEKYYSP